MVLGTIMIGAYIAISSPDGYHNWFGLFAFMMLSGRVAAPLVGLAKLVEDREEVGAAIGEIASVLNRPLENDSGGVRPNFAGAITFQDVTFNYAGNRMPALDQVSFLNTGGRDAGRRRAQWLRQIHHRPPAAGHQSRLSAAS